jgi:hypothetical protein
LSDFANPWRWIEDVLEDQWIKDVAPFGLMLTMLKDITYPIEYIPGLHLSFDFSIGVTLNR